MSDPSVLAGGLLSEMLVRAKNRHEECKFMGFGETEVALYEECMSIGLIAKSPCRDEGCIYNKDEWRNWRGEINALTRKIKVYQGGKDNAELTKEEKINQKKDAATLLRLEWESGEDRRMFEEYLLRSGFTASEVKDLGEYKFRGFSRLTDVHSEISERPENAAIKNKLAREVAVQAVLEKEGFKLLQANKRAYDLFKSSNTYQQMIKLGFKSFADFRAFRNSGGTYDSASDFKESSEMGFGTTSAQMRQFYDCKLIGLRNKEEYKECLKLKIEFGLWCSR